MENNNKGETKGKGLTDQHDGGLILNETGVSVDAGHLQDLQKADDEQQLVENLPHVPEGEDVEKGRAEPRYDITDRV